MAKKSKNNALFLIAVGLLIIIFVVNIGTTRTAKPEYDGQPNNFKLTLLSKVTPAIALENYALDLEVYNTGIAGSMYVQCSILDRNKYTFLKNIQAIYLPYQDNCVANEPFTQTAKVTLNTNAKENLRFTIKTPNTPAGDNVIYCSAYERCYDPIAEDTMESDYLIRPVEVKPALATTPPNNNQVDNGTGVTGGTQIDFSDSAIKEWMRENKILLIGIGLALLLIGAALIYKEPKQQVMF